jgi:hypothetical protein
MYHALCYLPHFIALSPTDHTLPHFLLLIALYGAFSRLLRFSPLTALYPALFRTLPFNPRSFAYCALSRFTLVIFVLSRFNSLYVATLVLSRFSCCTLLSPALPLVNLFYRALPCFTRFKLFFTALPCLCPTYPFILSHAHFSILSAFLFSPSLSFYAPLCQTSPCLQTYAQLALISYPYAQLIHFSLFLPLPFSPSVCPITSSLLPRLYYIYIYHVAQNFPNIFQHLQNPMLISYVYA